MEPARNYKELNKRFASMFSANEMSSGRMKYLAECPRNAMTKSTVMLVTVDNMNWESTFDYEDAKYAAMALAFIAGLEPEKCQLFLCDGGWPERLVDFVDAGGTLLAEIVGNGCEPLSERLGLAPVIPIGNTMLMDDGKVRYMGPLDELVADYMYAYHAWQSACALLMGRFGIYDLPELVELYSFGKVSVGLARRYESELASADFLGHVLESVLPANGLPKSSNNYQEESRRYREHVRIISRIWFRSIRRSRARDGELHRLLYSLERDCTCGMKTPAQSAGMLADALGIESCINAVLECGVPLADVMA